FPRGTQDRTQTFKHSLCRSLWIDRLELAVQGRELQGDVTPRNPPVVVLIELRSFLPRIDLRGEFGDEVEVLLLVGVGFRVADDGFAQQIEREGEPLPAKPGDGLQNLIDV